MKKNLQILMLLFFVFAFWACIPVPVPVGTTTTTIYEEPYGNEYDDSYVDNDYVDVPIVFGEPMYYAPPVAVSFAFDYFTYESAGGFVDVVFWRDGHRYRREPWYDKGRRISPNDIRTGKQHYRVNRREFTEHREKLRRNHNISHPDAYYKLERYKQKEKQKRLEDRYKYEREMREQKEKQRLIEERNKRELEMRKQKEKQRFEEERNRQELQKREQQEKQRRLEERYKQERERNKLEEKKIEERNKRDREIQKQKDKQKRERYKKTEKEKEEDSRKVPPSPPRTPLVY